MSGCLRFWQIIGLDPKYRTLKISEQKNYFGLTFGQCQRFDRRVGEGYLIGDSISAYFVFILSSLNHKMKSLNSKYYKKRLYLSSFSFPLIQKKFPKSGGEFAMFKENKQKKILRNICSLGEVSSNQKFGFQNFWLFLFFFARVKNNLSRFGKLNKFFYQFIWDVIIGQCFLLICQKKMHNFLIQFITIFTMWRIQFFQ